MSHTLVEFIKDSCRAGKTHDDIRSVLKEGGWPDEEVEGALRKFVDRDYPVAIPKPVIFASPRLIFLNLFHFVVLYLATYDVIALLFTFLDYYMPDGLGRMQGAFYSSHPIGEAMRTNLAIVICTVPLVWLTSVVINRAIRSSKQPIPRIRLNLIYLTLFIGACVMLGNGVCFVNYFLSGELGARFLIKVAILTATTLGFFFYYKYETQEAEARA